jgi:hypothetical protein
MLPEGTFGGLLKLGELVEGDTSPEGAVDGAEEDEESYWDDEYEAPNIVHYQCQEGGCDDHYRCDCHQKIQDGDTS